MHADWENEQNRLEYVKKIITHDLNIKINKADIYKNDMKDINKEMWNELGPLAGLDSAITYLQRINDLKQNLSATTENLNVMKRYKRQLSSPYFARIDFKEDGSSEPGKIYIGIFGYRDVPTAEIIIYDWRAPVSSMFYDHEPGRASYICPTGIIEGELLLKRQYRIEEGNLKLMFDSSIVIEDEVLQDILAGSADNRMKVIVYTIQKEQNKAIRNENNRVLAVQGPAGSGKTSIALHRAAYLLYHHRDSIKAENIILYTPNELFARYISAILPELGEDNISGYTVVRLAHKVLEDIFDKYETYAEMMEWQALEKSANKAAGKGRLESIRFKASIQFADLLERYVSYYEDKIVKFEDIKYNAASSDKKYKVAAVSDISEPIVFITKEELDSLFHVHYRNMKIVKRFDRMKINVMERINEYRKTREQAAVKALTETGDYLDDNEIKARSRLIVRAELEPVYKKVEAMLSADVRQLYKTLFENTGVLSSLSGTAANALSPASCHDTAEALLRGTLCYEDQVPVLYLMLLMGGITPDNSIKHVIIDEAQDYTAISYKLFSKIYPECGVTVLGDACQNISPICGIGNIRLAGELIGGAGNTDYVELDKSYRSTVEIMEFASKILPCNGKPYGRHGEKPEILPAADLKDACKVIIAIIKDMKKAGLKSIAVICRTKNDCRMVYPQIRAKADLVYVENDDSEITEAVTLIPSYLAKGLEFDGVIAAILSEDDYIHDEDQLLYTVCTRALHRLAVCAVNGVKAIRKFSK